MVETLKDIGERALIAKFEKFVDKGDLPFNDDAEAFPITKRKSMVVKIDTFVAKTDAPPNMTTYQMGAKAVTLSVSDFAAKGVQPEYILASGAFPDSLTVNQTIDLVKGISDTTHFYGAKFLGGDTNSANDIIVSSVAIGRRETNRLIKRATSNDEDIICTTGLFGLTGAGFKVFLNDYICSKKQREKFGNAIFNPKARLQEGVFFSKTGKITSCIDSSDGLAWCLKELLRNKNNFGIIIDRLPISPEVIAFAKNNYLSSDDLALYGGEEFELVFTLKKDDLKIFDRKFTIYPMGKVTKDFPGKIMLKKPHGFEEIKPKGWEHFSNKDYI